MVIERNVVVMKDTRETRAKAKAGGEGENGHAVSEKAEVEEEQKGEEKVDGEMKGSDETR